MGQKKSDVRRRAFGYVRVSREDPKREKWSAPTQRQRITDYCKLHELDLIDIAEDRNVSGKTPFDQRLGWLSISQRLRKDDLIVVNELTRLGRSLLLTLNLLEALDEIGVGVTSIEHQFDTSSPTGRLVLHMMLSISQFERELLITRLHQVHDEIHRQGRFVGYGQIYGYDYKDKMLTINEPEAEIVKNIFELKSRGYGLQRIARQLRTDGIRGKRGGQWTAGMVKRVLLNELYVGLRTYNNETLPVDVPVIIDPDLWAITQAKVITQKHKDYRRDYPLSSLLVCGLCKKNMVRNPDKPPNPKGLANYRCLTNIRGGDCGGASIREHVAEEYILSELFKHIEASRYKERIKEQEKNPVRKKVYSQLVTLRRRVRQLENKQAKLLDEFMSDNSTITRKQFDQQNKKYNMELGEIGDRIVELEAQSILEATPSIPVGDIKNDWQRLSPIDQREALRIFIDRVEVLPVTGSNKPASRVSIVWK